jgi:CheY-like chemotaxis protein
MRMKKTVLVVDDDELVASMIRGLLEEDGHIVVCCHNSLAVVDIAKDQTFDVVLIDYHMPYMKGDMVCRLLRHIQRDAFIIGCSSEQLGKVFMNAGADTFISKDRLAQDLALTIRSQASC